MTTRKDNPLGDWGDLSSLAALGGIVGLGTAYLMPMLMKMFKEKTMTAMEKAMMALLKLVLQKVEDQDSEIEKLEKRPTQESLDAVHREADSLRYEIERLRKERVATVPHASPRRGKKS